MHRSSPTVYSNRDHIQALKKRLAALESLVLTQERPDASLLAIHIAKDPEAVLECYRHAGDPYQDAVHRIVGGEGSVHEATPHDPLCPAAYSLEGKPSGPCRESGCSGNVRYHVRLRDASANDVAHLDNLTPEEALEAIEEFYRAQLGEQGDGGSIAWERAK